MTAVISANNTKFKKGISGAKAQMMGFSKSVNKLGAGLTPFLGITAGVAGLSAAMRSAFRIITDFEQAMADVQSITRATGSELDMLKESAMALGGTTKFTASEVAALQKEFAKLGFTSNEIVEVSEAVLDLAAATGTELARAAEVAGVTLRAFGIQAKNTQSVTDLMASSFTTSALDMEKFAESMKLVAPIARAAGVSIEETTAMLAIMADAGISGSIAGTSLRKIFTELSTEGATLAENMRMLSEEGITLSSAQDDVGARAKSALLILDKQLDIIPLLAAAYKDASGQAREMAEIQLATVKGQTTILKSSYQGLVLAAAETTDGLKDTKQTIQGASTSLQFFTKNIEVFSRITSTIGKATGSISVFPQLIKTVGRDWGKMNDEIAETEPLIEQLGGVVDDLTLKLYKGIVGFRAIGDSVKTYFTDAFAKAVPEISKVKELFEGELGLSGEDANMFSNFFDSTVTSTKNWSANIIDLWGSISFSDMFEEDFQETLALTDDFNEAFFRKLARRELIEEQAADAAERRSQRIASAFAQIGSSFANAIGTMAAGTQTMEEKMRELGTMIIGALGDIMIMAGVSVGFTPLGVGLILGGLALKGISAFRSEKDSLASQGVSMDSSINRQGGSVLYGNDIRNSNDYYTNFYNQVG